MPALRRRHWLVDNLSIERLSSSESGEIARSDDRNTLFRAMVLTSSRDTVGKLKNYQEIDQETASYCK